MLVAKIAASAAARPSPGSDAAALEGEEATSPTILHDLVEGARWLATTIQMRTLVLTIVAFNVTFGAAWSVLVLYVGDRLGMDQVGFGLITAAGAIGGVIGTALYGPLERRFSLGNIMRVGLIIETFTRLTLALTRSPAVALITMVVFGAHAFVWGTTATSIRQRAVPDHLMGGFPAVSFASASSVGSSWAPRSAACWRASSGSPRPSGSASSARRFS